MKERIIASVERGLKSTARLAENAIIKRPYLLVGAPSTALSLAVLGVGLAVGDPVVTRVSVATSSLSLAVLTITETAVRLDNLRSKRN